MVKLDTTIINKLGLHARAASKFVSLASKFNSDIRVTKDNQTVNGKSIMGMMMLAAAKDTQLTLTVKGSDEQEALEQLILLIKNRFEENE